MLIRQHINDMEDLAERYSDKVDALERELVLARHRPWSSLVNKLKHFRFGGGQ